MTSNDRAMILSPLQTAANNLEVIMVFVSLLAAIILSFVIGIRGVRSYRRSRNWGTVLLVVGILLVSGVPTGINVILTTVTAVPGWLVATMVDLIRLVGLVVILTTIYEK